MKNTETNNRLSVRYIVVLAIGSVTLLIVLTSGCESSNPVRQLNQIVFPDSGISYHQQVQPIFDISCTYSGCHDDGTTAGGLSLTNWSNANRDPGNIVPRNPDQSKLVQVLERKLIHVNPLDTIQNHIKGIRRWVLEGALNN